MVLLTELTGTQVRSSPASGPLKFSRLREPQTHLPKLQRGYPRGLRSRSSCNLLMEMGEPAGEGKLQAAPGFGNEDFSSPNFLINQSYEAEDHQQSLRGFGISGLWASESHSRVSKQSREFSISGPFKRNQNSCLNSHLRHKRSSPSLGHCV